MIMTIALALGWPLCGLAADPVDEYQIEVIIFSHITPEGLGSEYWPQVAPLIVPDNAIELPADQIVPHDQQPLNSLVRLLERNHFLVLLHLAWRESAEQARQGTLIHLQGDQVNGSVAVNLDRFFTLNFNLQFILPWGDVSQWPLPNIPYHRNDDDLLFNLNQSLRMRSNELNYIDHPLYGILIHVTPSQPTAE